MKNQITIAAFLFTAIILMASCGSKNSASKMDKTAPSENSMYQCPMKCEGDKIYDEMGICPVCKMDLKNVNGKNHHHNNTKETKPKSPRTSAMDMVGNNHVHIEYGSPSVRGRIIWNGLVAYGQVWATGAHTATSIEFSRDVKINDQIIEKGKYGFFTIPEKDEWTIILSKDWDMHLADEYTSESDAIRFKVKPIKTETLTEALTYEIKSLSNKKGQVSMSWEYLTVMFEFANMVN
jgi:hypothetical protein